MIRLPPDDANKPAPTGRAHQVLPKSVWVLGFVSMLMDISSELIHSLLPVFMATVLGASMVTIGVIEGVAEATAAMTKVFSGVLSDYFRKRKSLVVLGYGVGALAKLVFPLATSVWWVFGGRFLDRIGKGIRVSPRDALIADITPRALRGAAYGLRQSLDTAGAFVGPLLAVLFMIWLANDIKTVLWLAVAPAFLAVSLLVLAVREPEATESVSDSRNHLTLSAAKQLPLDYWFVVTLGAVFTLARFSEAFLILLAHDVGLAVTYVPAIMIVMNIVYALFAYPAGLAADRVSARMLLIIGLVVLVVADLLLSMARSSMMAFLGAAFWGMHMAFTQGLLTKLVADTAPSRLRGTAFGIFNFVTGLALLLASIIAGLLWNFFGAPATFMTGAAFAAIAAMGLYLYRPEPGATQRTGM